MTQWGIDTLFNPAKRHMDEEKRRLQSTRQQIGDNSGGKRIDLESGRVKIARADDDEADGVDTAAEGAPAETADAPAVQREKPEKAVKAAKGKRAKDAGEPSAAAKRAAARRGRTLE